MFDVHFFRADKLVNSTKQYQLSQASLTLRCEINSPCSVVNPVLLINAEEIDASHANVWAYNYCYIGIWGRFYFIHDWVFSNGLWIATASEDVLATYRSAILSSVLYVMRSTYDNNGNVLYNGDIADGTYPTTANSPTYQSSAVNNPYAIDDVFNMNGTFIVGIINSHSSNGSVTYYAFNIGGFMEFCQKLFSYSSGWLNINTDEISEDLQKALVNPFQYVVSCIYLPIDRTELSSMAYTSTQTINFGWWAVTIFSNALLVNSSMFLTKTSSLSIPRHPLASSRGSYLNLSPYSIYTLRYYPYGTFNIDSEAIAGWITLDLYSSVDIITGKGVLDIAVNGRNNTIRTVEAQIGVQIPTASLQTNFQQIVSGITGIAAAGAELTGALNKVHSEKPNPAEYSGGIKGFLGYAWDTTKSVINDLTDSVKQSGGITQVATNILSTAIAASTTAEIQGMQGTGSLFQAQTLTLSGRFLPIAEEDLTHTGRPLMQLRQLSGLRGFTVCKDGDVLCYGNDREKAAIKAFLEGGFFIE